MIASLRRNARRTTTPFFPGGEGWTVQGTPQAARSARLAALTPLEQDELRQIIGEAALDLWAQGEEWPDLVERCLQAIEEEARAGRIPVVAHHDRPARA